MPTQPDIQNNTNLALYFAMIIATIFVALFCIAFVVDILNPNYDIPAGIYPILTIIIGAIMGYVFKRSANGAS
jgi:tetrahydromethanopterin S-methyltransferase subunit C